MDLTPEERQRIYLEEKARAESRVQIEAERKSDERRGYAIGCAGIVVLFIIIASITAVLSDKKPPAASDSTASPESTEPVQTYATGASKATMRKVREVRRLMLSEGVISSWEGTTDHLDVTVGTRFYGLSFEQKSQLARCIAISESLRTNGRIVFHDYYDGHAIADFMLAQFRMK